MGLYRDVIFSIHYMSNGLTFAILHLPQRCYLLGHDLEMSCTKFYENRFRIDEEIDEKHALQIISQRLKEC